MKTLAWVGGIVVLFCSLCLLCAYLGVGVKVGPQASDYKKYKLASGRVIECAGTGDSYCGLYFYKCTDGKEYQCQTNVEPQ